jgi:tetratricopeptide (TPR) repeat protein
MFMKNTRFSILLLTNLLLLFWVALPLSSEGQDYLGASAVLKQVAEQNSQPAAPQSTNALSSLRDDLKKFGDTVTNLPPDQAAKGWLDLVDRTTKTHPSPMAAADPTARAIDAQELFAALPPPAGWQELSRAIAARPKKSDNSQTLEIGLHFLAATLNNDTNARSQEITNLQAFVKGGDMQTAMTYRFLLQQLNEAILQTSDNPDAILSSLDDQIAGTSSGFGVQQINVPNLIAQVGPEKAEIFLRKALIRVGVTLQFSEPNETSRLAQKLALELIDQLKAPQWGLVNSLDAVALYEALDKRFPAETNQVSSATGIDMGNMQEDMGYSPKSQAKVYYFLGLISQGRAADAVAITKKMGPNISIMEASAAFQKMEHAGFAKDLDNFFYELLSGDPTLPVWNEYVQVAAEAGTTDRMLTLARASVARQDFSDKKKATIASVLYKALLAADQPEEAVQELHRLLAAEPPSQQSYSYGYQDNGTLAAELARLGLLLHKPEWIQEGAADVKKWLRTFDNNNQGLSWSAGPVLVAMEDILFKSNQGLEAESLLTDATAILAKPNDTRQNFGRNNSSASSPALAPLALLYHQAGRQSDVLTLLEQSPDWGASDLAKLTDQMSEPSAEMFIHAGTSSPPLAYLAADALLATGRKPEAQKVTEYLLNQYPGLDRGYELLIAQQGNDAIPRLDQQFARDQFEERPLIWKAHLLRQQNKLTEAEAVARQAIAIDPSDGEEGRGDRMRAYSELADIRDAQGEKKDADFYREVVKSIRMSEDADEYYKAGLLKRAIPMYEEALNHFADAYCIQSRLAIQLAELGKTQEAEEHYRRAYELMPDSFGRVESHCFGCEGVFNGEFAQNIAEGVFTKLVAARPDKPQVHYLLGYLREEQERYKDALTNYQAAVRLDPSYLNAWNKLDGISSHVMLPAKDRDQIVFNILRLDPLLRHASCYSFSEVSDLPGLWNAVAAANRFKPATTTNLLTLTASKAALEKKPHRANGMDEEQYYDMARQNQERISAPGDAVLQNAFINFASQLIVNNNFMEQ